MTARKAKAQPLRCFAVPVEYTVRGTIIVEAVDAEQAQEANHAHLFMLCEPTMEIVDWEVTGDAVEEP